jgi:hypothetical protein
VVQEETQLPKVQVLKGGVNMGKELSKGDHLFEVLNPSGLMREAALAHLAARVPNLTSKVVYCVSQYVGGADVFLKKIADALPHYVPQVKAVYRRKTTAYMADDTELWDEIVKDADAVIYGCAA